MLPASWLRHDLPRALIGATGVGLAFGADAERGPAGSWDLSWGPWTIDSGRSIPTCAPPAARVARLSAQLASQCTDMSSDSRPPEPIDLKTLFSDAYRCVTSDWEAAADTRRRFSSWLQQACASGESDLGAGLPCFCKRRGECYSRECIAAKHLDDCAGRSHNQVYARFAPRHVLAVVLTGLARPSQERMSMALAVRDSIARLADREVPIVRFDGACHAAMHRSWFSKWDGDFHNSATHVRPPQKALRQSAAAWP